MEKIITTNHHRKGPQRNEWSLRMDISLFYLASKWSPILAYLLFIRWLPFPLGVSPYTTPAQSGSLCNLREVIRRRSVSKCSMSVMNSLCTPYIPHGSATDSWLQETAEMLAKTLMPTNSTDPVFKMHRSFLHSWENGSGIGNTDYHTF